VYLVNFTTLTIAGKLSVKKRGFEDYLRTPLVVQSRRLEVSTVEDSPEGAAKSHVSSESLDGAHSNDHVTREPYDEAHDEAHAETRHKAQDREFSLAYRIVRVPPFIRALRST
jgi:hypothetical protein